MKPSTRVERIQAPVIPDVAALLAANPSAISLGQGVPGYAPPAEFLQAAATVNPDPATHSYQAGDGMPELLHAWRETLAADNRVPRDEGTMLVTAGSNMAFLQLMAVIADPGDQVILPTPYFFNQRMALESLSIEPVLAPTDADFQLDLGQLTDAITSRTRAIVTISPNNPTGAVYDRETLTAVNQLCAARGLLHVSDEAYQHFVFDGAEHFSPASLPGASEHTVSLFSMSKSFGMAGWRIGAMVAPSELSTNLRKMQDTNLICAPVPSQRLATVLLTRGARWRAQRIAELAARRLEVLDELSVLEGVEIPETAGAFYFMLRLPMCAPDMPIVERLIREFGVALIPGSAFGAGPRVHLRLAYASLTAKSLRTAATRLRDGLRAVCAEHRQ